ncbi:hypothetical protein P8C59_009116 [Phyllachora maydis]|uniref:Uncharacterized protein n=1 Tax=Phyllachora maydis TaxID=1825666 RepID=A0AAD9IBU4_9PEZI|nr:hypothetical protein P8C59_009116 [Phyllachora maydis]
MKWHAAAPPPDLPTPSDCSGREPAPSSSSSSSSASSPSSPAPYAHGNLRWATVRSLHQPPAAFNRGYKTAAAHHFLPVHASPSAAAAAATAATSITTTSPPPSSPADGRPPAPDEAAPTTTTTTTTTGLDPATPLGRWKYPYEIRQYDPRTGASGAGGRAGARLERCRHCGVEFGHHGDLIRHSRSACPGKMEKKRREEGEREREREGGHMPGPLERRETVWAAHPGKTTGRAERDSTAAAAATLDGAQHHHQARLPRSPPSSRAKSNSGSTETEPGHTPKPGRKPRQSLSPHPVGPSSSLPSPSTKSEATTPGPDSDDAACARASEGAAGALGARTRFPLSIASILNDPGSTSG